MPHSEEERCPYEFTIHDLSKQADKMDKFIDDAEPLLEYVRAEIARNHSRTEFYNKITEQVLGAGVLLILGTIGTWLIAKLKFDFHFH
jgi:hypothetical protein